jgi:hypothetical protein
MATKKKVTPSKTKVTPIKKKVTPGKTKELTALIEIHQEAAKHHQEAAKHHFEAVKLMETGKHEKAWESLVRAHGQHSLASEAQHEILKLHAHYNNVLFRSHIKKYKAK